jgi:hypothetical protein
VNTGIFHTPDCEKTPKLFLCFLAGFVFFIKSTERPASVTTFIAGFGMNSDSCPRELNLKIRFEMVGKIMGLEHGYGPWHDKVEFDKNFRT